MTLLDSFILGALQGITEFLPISSSGHLVLGEHYLGLKIETLKSFDVVVHMGTLLAILIYFWKDVLNMLLALFKFIFGKIKANDNYIKLWGYILIGTLPAAFFGLFWEDWIDSVFRNVISVGIFMFIVGIVFIIGEYSYKRVGKRDMRWYKAIVIGMAQAIALIPGVSRSGSTIVAGLFQGIERSESARFSFLLGIPAIFGAGLLTSIKIFENGGTEVSILSLSAGFLSSFVFGLLSVSFLMRFLKRNTLIVFSIYLVALGFSVFIASL